LRKENEKIERILSLGKICVKGAAFMRSMFMIQALCFLLSWEARAGGSKANGQMQAHADYARLAGTWMRPDGDYVMELKAGIFV
jgi:hypothetical protein